jgi:Fe-Mn family superoxide dismutase
MNRRHALKLMAGAAAFVGMAGRRAARAQQPVPFTLPPLGYAFDALEPFIDTATMRIHHDNHHAGYVNNLNALVKRWPQLATTPAEDILFNTAMIPIEHRTAIRNNLGGHWNHTFFWDLMTPGGAKQPTGDFAAALNEGFDEVDDLKAAVKQVALAQFGSGWAWLAVSSRDRALLVFSTANQDTPQMARGAKPILGIDLWEHAYYLKYQSKRADYVDAWWNTLNWDKVDANFKKAIT